MTDRPTTAARLPPRWVVRSAWAVHRAIHRITGGRRGLRPATPGQWGMMRLQTIGRRTGEPRAAILGYFDDGPNLVTMAMNGWADPEPAWWLNLQAQPAATVELKSGSWRVRGRAATADERPRLWAMWSKYNDGNLDAYAARRSRTTQVVVLEPVNGRAPNAASEAAPPE